MHSESYRRESTVVYENLCATNNFDWQPVFDVGNLAEGSVPTLVSGVVAVASRGKLGSDRFPGENQLTDRDSAPRDGRGDPALSAAVGPHPE